MAVSEQTDSLRVLGSDPVDYLITPRVAACMIAGPILNLMCFCMGAPPLPVTLPVSPSAGCCCAAGCKQCRSAPAQLLSWSTPVKTIVIPQFGKGHLHHPICKSCLLSVTQVDSGIGSGVCAGRVSLREVYRGCAGAYLQRGRKVRMVACVPATQGFLDVHAQASRAACSWRRWCTT